MKKLINLILIIFLLVFIFFSCEEENSTNTLMDSPIDQSLTKNLSKKPAKEPPKISYLRFVEEPKDPAVTGEIIEIITNDEIVLPAGSLIDLTKNTYRIEYNITHPTDIDYLQLHLIYDHNCGSETNNGMPIEYDGRIGRFEFNDENDTDIERVYDWEGLVRTGLWESRVGLYQEEINYTMFDQLATYNDSGSPESGADQYLLYIWTGPGYYEKIANLWIKAEDPLNVLNVENIEIDLIPEKGPKVYPRATIKVNKPGVYVWAQWSGVVSSNYVAGGPSGDDGKIFINGPIFNKNVQGDLIITIADLEKEYGCYDPYSDNQDLVQGVWPAQFTFQILKLE